MSRILGQIRVAVMFLTRLPVGRMETPPALSDCAWAFPLAGLAPALIAWVGFTTTGGAFGAALALTLAMLVTGGLHFDGLADFADGMGGGRDRAQVLEIMKDSRIGSYGVLALIAVAALQVTAVAEVGTLPAFLFLGVASRIAMLAMLTRVPPAGEGLSALAKGEPHFWRSGLLALLLGVWMGTSALAATAAMLAVFWAVRKLVRKRIGGQTGDVCGATQLLCETAGWGALVLAL